MTADATDPRAYEWPREGLEGGVERLGAASGTPGPSGGDEAREPAYSVGDLVYVYEQPPVEACPMCHKPFDEPQDFYLIKPNPCPEDDA